MVLMRLLCYCTLITFCIHLLKTHPTTQQLLLQVTGKDCCTAHTQQGLPLSVQPPRVAAAWEPRLQLRPLHEKGVCHVRVVQDGP